MVRPRCAAVLRWRGRASGPHDAKKPAAPGKGTAGLVEERDLLVEEIAHRFIEEGFRSWDPLIPDWAGALVLAQIAVETVEAKQDA